MAFSCNILAYFWFYLHFFRLGLIFLHCHSTIFPPQCVFSFFIFCADLSHLQIWMLFFIYWLFININCTKWYYVLTIYVIPNISLSIRTLFTIRPLLSFRFVICFSMQAPNLYNIDIALKICEITEFIPYILSTTNKNRWKWNGFWKDIIRTCYSMLFPIITNILFKFHIC